MARVLTVNLTTCQRISIFLVIIYLAITTSLTICYADVNADAWTQIGPEARDVSYVAVDPSNTSILYSASDQGVFKSLDGGASWRPINNGLSNGSGATPTVLRVVLDPQTPTTIYALVYFRSVTNGTEGGIFKSTDGGQNWTSVTNGLSDNGRIPIVRNLAVDPLSPFKLYAGTASGVFKSSDSGLTWTSSSNGLLLADGWSLNVTAIVIHPTSPSTLYVATDAGFDKSGLFKSLDGGETWALARQTTWPTSIVIDPSEPQTVYVGGIGDSAKSTDGGVTWQAISAPDITRLIIGPSAPHTLFAIDMCGYEAPCRVYKSGDKGITWQPLNRVNDLTLVVPNSLAVSPSDSNTMYLATNNGVFKSVDEGNSWVGANTTPSNHEVTDLGVDPIDSEVVYTIIKGIGIYKSVNGGGDWWQLNVSEPPQYLEIDPTNSSVLYATAGGALYKTTNGGAFWFSLLGTGLPSGTTLSLAVDPVSPSTLYVGRLRSANNPGEESVYKSINSGASWVPTGLRQIAQALAIAPTSPSTIYAGVTPFGLWKSTDGGATWQESVSGLGQSYVNTIVLDPITPSTVYAGTSNGVYKSTDAGASWQSASSGLFAADSEPLDVKALAISPLNPSILYAGLGSQSGLVFRSENGGESWIQDSLGLGSFSATRLLLTPAASGAVYAGTTQGLFKKLVPSPQSNPVLSVTFPASLDFGSVVLNAISDMSGAVTNTGGGTLTGSVSTNSPFGIASGDSFNLAAGASQSIVVRFNPTTAGDFRGTVNFTSNVGSTSKVFSGTGVVPDGAVLSVSPSKLPPFSAQNVSTPSPPQTITLVNAGSQDLSLQSISVVGSHLGDFAITANNCGTSLTPNTSCNLEITFTPSGEGQRSAAVRITSNAPDSPANLALEGSGRLPDKETTFGAGQGNGSGSVFGILAEPVNTATGNYYYQHTDLAMPGRGFGVAFTRTLNLQDNYSGPMGPGWTHSYNLFLTQSADGSVVIKMGDGHQEYFQPSDDGAHYQARDPGVFNMLVKNGDGSFTLTEKNQHQLAFNASGKLTGISDRNDNSLSVGYDTVGNLVTITDTVGRIVNLSYDANHRLVKITDPGGRKVEYAYDGAGRLITDTDSNGGIQRYRYNAEGLLDQITDRNGHTLIVNTYDGSKRVVSQSNGKGAVTTFAYDTPAAGQTLITDGRGGVTIHTHDVLRRLTTDTDPLGHSIRYVYDANNNRTQVNDRNDNVTRFAYDELGNVTAKTDALGKVTTMDYGALNDPIKIVDARQGTTQFSYDTRGNLTSITNGLGKVTSITYDVHGQPLTMTDPLGHTTRNTFDAAGNLIRVEDALGNKTQFTYDAIGRRTGVTDAKGNTVSFGYDANGNLKSVTDPYLKVTAYTYDAQNNRISITDPRGNRTTLVYDANDLLTEVIDALSNKTTFAYDAADNRIRVTDPRGNSTTYEYDAANRLSKVTDALSKVTRLAHDKNGNLLSQTNPLGHVSGFAYDALNRLTSATDALGHKGTRSYDELGRLIASQDAKGRITQYAYDALGRLTRVTDPANGTVVYAYDAAGNRTGITDPNGHTTQMAYDELNRLKQKSDPLGNLYHYAYDAVGNRNSLTDAKGQLIQYVYDANRRLTEIQYPNVADNVQFSYDEAGNRTHMTDKLGDSSYVYDKLNRLTGYTDPFGKFVANEYDAAGNRSALVYPDGKKVTYGYDKLNRMATVTDWLGGVTTYSYDDTGNLAQIINPNQTATTYGYDNAERLVQLANVKLVDNSVLASYALTLDAVGNRTGINRTEPVAPILRRKSEAYVYDEDNRLLNINGSAFSFDANGNQIQHDGTTYGYDFEDRLVNVAGTNQSEYGYDGTGNRLKAIRGGSETRYTLDIGGPLSNVLVEDDAGGNLTAYYVHGLGLISRITPSGDTHYYQYDTIGSTIALTDANAAITNAYAYDAFGEVLNERNGANAGSNPFRYVGKFGVMEEQSGLKFMRNRYYLGSLGLFSVKDPLGKYQNINTSEAYIYANNSPPNRIDPIGLWSWTADAKATLTTSLAVGWNSAGVAISVVGCLGTSGISCASVATNGINVINSVNDFSKAGGSLVANSIGSFLGLSPITVNGVYDPWIDNETWRNITTTSESASLLLGLADIGSSLNSLKTVTFLGPGSILTRAPVEAYGAAEVITTVIGEGASAISNFYESNFARKTRPIVSVGADFSSTDPSARTLMAGARNVTPSSKK